MLDNAFSAGIMRALYSLLLALLIAVPVHAQLAEGGARALGLGRAATALEGELWGEFNPASVSSIDANSAEAFASQAFGLNELRVVALAIAAPTKYATFSAYGRSYGFSEYRETRVGLGVARGIPLSSSRQIDLGVNVQAHSISIEGFGSTTSVSASFGAQVDVLPTLRAGLHARNISHIVQDDEAELTAPLSTAPAIAAGLAYRATDSATILLDAEKDLDFPVAIRAAVEVWVMEMIALRGGFATGLSSDGGAPSRLSGGIGFRSGMIHADVAAEYHETLGLTPAVSVGVDF